MRFLPRASRSHADRKVPWTRWPAAFENRFSRFLWLAGGGSSGGDSATILSVLSGGGPITARWLWQRKPERYISFEAPHGRGAGESGEPAIARGCGGCRAESGCSNSATLPAPIMCLSERGAYSPFGAFATSLLQISRQGSRAWRRPPRSSLVHRLESERGAVRREPLCTEKGFPASGARVARVCHFGKGCGWGWRGPGCG